MSRYVRLAPSLRLKTFGVLRELTVSNSIATVTVLVGLIIIFRTGLTNF